MSYLAMPQPLCPPRPLMASEGHLLVPDHLFPPLIYVDRMANLAPRALFPVSILTPHLWVIAMKDPANLVNPAPPRVGVEGKELVAGFRTWSAGSGVLPVKATDAWNRGKRKMSDIRMAFMILLPKGGMFISICIFNPLRPFLSFIFRLWSWQFKRCFSSLLLS